ncbi:hypothetical protein PGIGA_G00070130 [Pangasianodon gigas]|uniref:Uncharacterized protein n=1 Tax=Pangasianodon gigas TaxID=30993 RepID=A0ACC5X7S2_PANGG|nr:hypothetical protein [Pangasianodon gigas]
MGLDGIRAPSLAVLLSCPGERRLAASVLLVHTTPAPTLPPPPPPRCWERSSAASEENLLLILRFLLRLPPPPPPLCTTPSIPPSSPTSPTPPTCTTPPRPTWSPTVPSTVLSRRTLRRTSTTITMTRLLSGSGSTVSTRATSLRHTIILNSLTTTFINTNTIVINTTITINNGTNIGSSSSHRRHRRRVPSAPNPNTVASARWCEDTTGAGRNSG